MPHEHEHVHARREEWDERYSEHDQMWSGEPNGSLTVEVAELMPGRALDVGCGEGADAVWLAQRGWTVTAIDVSTVAIDRARAASNLLGITVEWIAGDVLTHMLDDRAFELVSVHYPAFLFDRDAAAVERIISLVAPGGTLLVVGHALDHDARAHAAEHGFDPDAYVAPADFVADLDDAWQVEVHEQRPRVHPPAGSIHADDIVVRARRNR